MDGTYNNVNPQEDMMRFLDSLPQVRIAACGLLTVHIPTNRVDVTNITTGITKPLDITNMPPMRNRLDQYVRVIYTQEPDMLMYYNPISQLVFNYDPQWM